MEAGTGIFGIVALLVIVGLALYYGAFSSLETAARMGNRKVERLEAEQIKEDIAYYNDNAIDADEYKTALTQKKTIAAYRDL